MHNNLCNDFRFVFGILAASLLIKIVYGNFPNAPDPLAYAFLGHDWLSY